MKNTRYKLQRIIVLSFHILIYLKVIIFKKDIVLLEMK